MCFNVIDGDESGNKYIVIHSGSRNLGTQVAEFYQNIAIDLNLGKEEYYKRRDEIIRTYKEQGRRSEIQDVLKNLKNEFEEKEPTMPPELCYLYGSLICMGKGNSEWNYSTPHGAGRIMSRSAALEQLTMEEYKKEMAGIYTTCVNTSTLDESPMAYKNMDEIIANIEPTAEITAHIRPVYNFKASE